MKKETFEVAYEVDELDSDPALVEVEYHSDAGRQFMLRNECGEDSASCYVRRRGDKEIYLVSGTFKRDVYLGDVRSKLTED